MEQQTRRGRARSAARPPVDFKGQFGERLTVAMERAGLDRAWFGYEVTKLSGVMTNEANIRRWTNGQAAPEAERLGHLADALGVTVDYLLGRAENPLGVVVPGWGEVGFAPEPAQNALEEITSEIEKRSGAGGSHSSREDSQVQTPARPRRARRPKPE